MTPILAMVAPGAPLGRGGASRASDQSAPPPGEIVDRLAVTGLQRTAALAAVALLIGVAVVATPRATTRLLTIPGYMTAFGSAMIVINILLAALLFSKGAIEKRGDAIRLGTAYLFVALVFLPLVACFPGGIMPGSVIGTPISAVWLWSFWHAGFGLLVIRYAWLAGRAEQRRGSLPASLVAVACIVVVLAVVSTTLLPYLPAVLADGHTLFSGAAVLIPLTILAILAVALALVCRLRARTPEQLWLAVAMVAALFDVWLTYRGSERFSLGWYLSKCGSLFTSLAVLITLLHEVTLLHSRAAAANAVLTGLAHQDGLTGLCNRRRLDELIATEWRRSGRDQQPMSLLMIDVDHFKSYNDRYGHPEGDECLRRVAALLQKVARRPSDVAARYGGEEFVLLLSATDATGALEMARRVQAEMHALAIVHAGSPHGWVTLSIGLATVVAEAGAPATALLAEADRGLYKAKQTGRDRACWADDRVLPDGENLLSGARQALALVRDA